MNLTNIFNKDRTIYLFTRDEEGNLKIKTDSSFFPYYYLPSDNGNCVGYDGKKLQKCFCSTPYEVFERRSTIAYEGDIQHTKRYLIDKIDVISPCKLRWMMMDTEILVPKGEMPNPLEDRKSPYPVSCIALYDNLKQEYKTWYLGDYKNEFDMLIDWADYLKNNSPDMLFCYNMYGFDWPYLYFKFPKLAERISPIGMKRYGKFKLDFPAGISILDYMEWIKKYTLNKEPSYALDSMMAKHLGKDKGIYKNMDFSKLSPEIIGRCKGDVEGMVKLEEKFKLIPNFDMTRRQSFVEWEDMLYNSRIIDSFLLKEAKKDGIVLPSKPSEEDNANVKFEGAFRDILQTGAFYQVGKYDLSGAYAYAIINLCLDSVNIVEEEGLDTVKIDIRDRETQNISASYIVKQNQNALLPKVVKILIDSKNILKKKLGETSPEAKEYKDLEQEYASYKSIVLSAWGVIGNKFFRRFDYRVAAMTTGVVRDLLHYVIQELKKRGYDVIYLDTDSVFILDSGKDLTVELNNIIQDWALLRFNKKVDIQFDREGSFESLLLLAMCRYLGYLRTSKGLKCEMKGIEAKRKDSTSYTKKFQEELINKILNKEEKENILNWIEEQINLFYDLPLTEIAIPCKISRKPEKYKNLPIFLRAMNETPGFKKQLGDNFYYIYVEPEYYEVEEEVIEYFKIVPSKREGKTKKEKLTKKYIKDNFGDWIHGKGSKEPECYPFKEDEEKLKKQGINWEIKTVKKIKAKDVKAFDEDTAKDIKNVDWTKMINRNIMKKIVVIFKAMGWEEDLKRYNKYLEKYQEDEEEEEEDVSISD